MSDQQVRQDGELRALDVPNALTRGLLVDGTPRRHLFSEAAIAASWQAQDLGVGPYPLRFLAGFVRSAGLDEALALDEPLNGAEPAALAREWFAAAGQAVRGGTAQQSTAQQLAVEELLARWIELVATLIAVRRQVA